MASYRILVPIDGSEPALRALTHALHLARLIGAAEIHLVNVQPPVSGSVAGFVGEDVIARFHREESDQALAGARQLLEDEGVPVDAVMRVGSAGETIADHAAGLACNEIVMGTRGLGRVAGLVLGSVATQVVHLTDTPVTLVK